MVETLTNLAPRWVKRLVPRSLKDRLKHQNQIAHDPASYPSRGYLESLLLNYQVSNLVNGDPVSFKKKIEEFLHLDDHVREGFIDPDKQRDLSVKFHWGHDHDFGTFALAGRMRDRHITLLAHFIDRFNAIPRSLGGLRILDIGCWTGGTSLLLCAMGAHVVAIEEVAKYIDSLNYLKYAFGIDRLEPRNLSLYECTAPEFQDAFDVVLFAGVLYHVTDPILALRITFNCLKNGGVCLLETASMTTNERLLGYQGPSALTAGGKGDRSRGGWNWFIPSPVTISTMMLDVGYTSVQIGEVVRGRVFAVGRRDSHVDMMRSGLSVRTVR